MEIKILEDGVSFSRYNCWRDCWNETPQNITVEVREADAVVKGQTASSSFKNAITTKDIKILVPAHIKEGDKIVINSESLEYLEKSRD